MPFSSFFCVYVFVSSEISWVFACQLVFLWRCATLTCYRVVATVIVTAIVIGRYKLFFENYVVYKAVREQKHAHVLLRSLSLAVAKIYKVCM